MPVQKFKTFEDAERALWNPQPDEAYYSRVAELWDFANKLNPIVYPKGIFKFRTIEEANKHREELELAHVKKRQSEKNSTIGKSFFVIPYNLKPPYLEIKKVKEGNGQDADE